MDVAGCNRLMCLHVLLGWCWKPVTYRMPAMGMLSWQILHPSFFTPSAAQRCDVL
jgi:hypothetical protein